MTKKNDQERLLDAVLMGEADFGYQEALLAETLRLVRKRRRSRQAQRIGGVLAVVSVITALAVWQNKRAPVIVPPPLVQNYQLILSHAFSTTSIVSTSPLAADQFVATKKLADVLHTSAMSGRCREVGDDELLALAAPQVAALVRRGPREMELVFVPSAVETIP